MIWTRGGIGSDCHYCTRLLALATLLVVTVILFQEDIRAFPHTAHFANLCNLLIIIIIFLISIYLLLPIFILTYLLEIFILIFENFLEISSQYCLLLQI